MRCIPKEIASDFVVLAVNGKRLGDVVIVLVRV